MKIIASMTTTSLRVGTVHLVVESLLRQTMMPDEIRVLVSREPNHLDAGIKKIPPKLLISGAKIQWTENIGPYRKLLPVLEESWREDVCIITFDDDMIYPPTTIARMVSAYRESRCAVSCGGRRITFKNGALMPYQEWDRNPANVADMMNFPIGRDSILYHPTFFTEKVFNPDTARLCGPDDDVWFRFNCIANSIPARIIGRSEGFQEMAEYKPDSLWSKLNSHWIDRHIKSAAGHLGIDFTKFASMAT